MSRQATAAEVASASEGRSLSRGGDRTEVTEATEET
jgi:hypothetical protein